MKARFDKFTLLAHITLSVGWLGAVVPYLALAIAGLTSHDPHVVRGAYPAMELIGWFVIVPLSLAALLSGLVQSLGTQWGLFRHWWIMAKFLLTIFATFVLLRHMQEVSRVSRMAAEAALSDAYFHALRIQLLVHPAGGLLVLFAVTAISMFKPWGMTPYGRHRILQTASRSRPSPAALVREPVVLTGTPRRARVVSIHAIHAVGVAVLVVVVLHLAGRGLHGH